LNYRDVSDGVDMGTSSQVEAVQLLGGRYRLVERLGGGGMSVVWLAYDEILGRQVAVKVVANQHLTHAASREWIRTEAQAAARLTHPHVTNVHDYGESVSESGERVPYVVMELVHGPTLAQRLKAGPVPVRTALLICAQVAAALAAAHARGLVHRDIKPGNIMLSQGGVKVVDFGIAAIAGQRGESPSDGEMWGTPAYLAPERLGSGEVVPASDVYALGLLLYRLLAGCLPWRAETVSQMINAHQYAEPAPLPELPDVPASVVELCGRCLSKEPQERPTAAEVARVLADASGWQVTSEAGSGDMIIGAGAAVEGAPELDDSEVDTRVVPLPIPVPVNLPDSAAAFDRADGENAPESAESAGAVVPAQAQHGKKRRLRALTAAGCALVLLAVGLLAGFCAAGTIPGRPGGPRPGAAGPSSGAPGDGGPTVGSPGAGAGPSGSPAGAPASNGATGATGATGASNGPGAARASNGGGGAAALPAPGSGGQGGGVSRTTAAPNAGPSPVERSVTTPGGTATCRCVGPTATLVAWDPLPGFTAGQVNPGPGTEVGLVFHAVATDIKVTFRCRNGVPEPTVG
jgi:eukaryotic-like serine/threonine-protein kinase